MTQNSGAVDLVQELSQLAHDGKDLTLGQLTDAFGARGFGPLIFLPAMMEVTPLGGVPGLPSFIAFFIVLIAVQILTGRSGFWLPDMIRRRQIDEESAQKAVCAMRPVAERMDCLFGTRLRALTVGPIRQLAAVVVIALCLTVPALELIPFASSVPMLAIAVIGFALMVEDGVLMLVGLGMAVAALIVAPLMLI